MRRHEENGQEIFSLFCGSAPESIMFPRAPEQKYVDIYPSPDQDQYGNFKDERRRQYDYEAEVALYWAVERLLRHLIVLHSFQFTHGQTCSIRNKKCKKCKKPHSTEGECDFLILGPNYCVIIEVKNMSHIENQDNFPNERETKIRALVGTFKKSVKQRDKIESLIKGFNQNTTVLKFTAYPNFSYLFKSQFKENSDVCLSDEELSTIIFKEDLLSQINESKALMNPSELFPMSSSLRTYITGEIRRLCWWGRTSSIPACVESCKDNYIFQERSPFAFWWDENVMRKVQSAQMTPEVRNILLAIWCTERFACDKSRCSLERCISEVDKKLREGQITLETKIGKNRADNPGVFRAPDVLKKYIGVNYLTSQQNDVLNFHDNFLWLNGVAGAGKSLLLCGKMIEIAQANEKVVLFRPWTGENVCSNEIYERALEKADIKFLHIKHSNDRIVSRAELSQLISGSHCNVIIVEVNYKADRLLDMLSVLDLDNCSNDIFIDDFQYVIRHIFSSRDKFISKLINELLQLSLKHKVWVASDLMQHGQYSVYITEILDVISDRLTDTQFISLSMNIRNTRNISNVLCVIRDLYIKRQRDDRKNAIEMTLPEQIAGHFIHGPKIIFHILDGKSQISGILHEELDRLTSNSDYLNNSDICIVHNASKSSFIDTVTSRCSVTDDKIAVYHSGNCYSAEWPAVIVIHNLFSNEDNLGELYLQVSRGRVYCSVLLYTDLVKGYSERDKILLSLLVEKLGNSAQIVNHSRDHSF